MASVQSLSAHSAAAFCLFAASIFVATSACYIVNCPLGGKRAVGGPPVALRQCMSCGPRGEGQCYGPDICCGPSIGCHMGTQMSAVCREEDSLPGACDVRGEPCGPGGEGRCAAVGVCCNDRSCEVEPSCDQPQSDLTGGSLDARKQQLNNALAAILQNYMSRGRGRLSVGQP